MIAAQNQLSITVVTLIEVLAEKGIINIEEMDKRMAANVNKVIDEEGNPRQDSLRGILKRGSDEG